MTCFLRSCTGLSKGGECVSKRLASLPRSADKRPEQPELIAPHPEAPLRREVSGRTFGLPYMPCHESGPTEDAEWVHHLPPDVSRTLRYIFR
jgi:hypothetical protein